MRDASMGFAPLRRQRGLSRLADVLRYCWETVLIMRASARFTTLKWIFRSRKAATMSEQQTTEWGLEARWVNLGEREPNHDDEVFARKTAEDFLTVIYFAEEGDIKYSINGESYIFDDQMDQWEWLELRPKEKPEPAVPLPDGIHEVTLPDGQSAFISDSGGYYGPAFPLHDGCKIEVSHCIQRIELPDGRAFYGFEENNSEPVVPLPDGRTLGVHELSNLSEMFRLQHHLNHRIGADMVDVDAVGDKEAIARWTQKFVTAMQQELAELVDCVPWKWWRPDEAQPYDRQNARVEIVDLFHFLISLAQLHGMSAEDVYNTYRAKCQINHKRQDSGYLKKDPDDCRGI